MAGVMASDPRLGPELQEHELEEALHAGAVLFDHEEFWEAHESWEAGWHRAPREERDFFQGLIHAAAACHHHRNANPEGYGKQREKMHLRLAAYGERHRGVAVMVLRAAVDALAEGTSSPEWPKLALGRPRD